MSRKNAIIHVVFALSMGASLSAQNTIGGTKMLVPEAEVTRQSKFVDAERDRMLGQYDKAITGYKAFLYDNPNNAAAWYGLGRCHISKKDFDAATEAVKKAIENEPANPWYAIYLADIYEKNARFNDAAALYENLIKQNPSEREYYFKLAYFQVLNKDPKAALKVLDKLEKQEGIREDISDKKHLIYAGLNDEKKAAAEYEKLVAKFPEKIEYRRRLAAFYERVQDEANARRVYADILRLKPDDPVARIGAMEKGKNSTGSAHLDKLKPLFADPKVAIDAKIKEILPYFDQLDRDNDPALKQNMLDIARSLEKTHSDDAKAWALSGDIFYHANQEDEALSRYLNCIKYNPKVFSVWDNALGIQKDQKKFPEMLKLAEQAIDAFPNQPKAYYYYALAALESGKTDDALSQLEQAALMAVKDAALSLDIADLAGVALTQKKDYAAAISRFEQALGKGGDKHPTLLEHYGDALAAAGQRDKALEMWKKAASIRKSPTLDKKING